MCLGHPYTHRSKSTAIYDDAQKAVKATALACSQYTDIHFLNIMKVHMMVI